MKSGHPDRFSENFNIYKSSQGSKLAGNVGTIVSAQGLTIGHQYVSTERLVLVWFQIHVLIFEIS